MRFTIPARRPAGVAVVVCVMVSLWVTMGPSAATAGSKHVQRYPFDPRYSQVACLAERPHVGLPRQTVPPSVASVLAATQGHFQSSVTCSWGYLIVLTPGSQALAADLRARFGSAVRIFIGPDPTKRTWSCWPFLGSTHAPRGLDLSLHLDTARVRTGSNFEGHLTINNRSAGSFLMDTGQPVLVEVVRWGTKQVVAGYTGAIAGTGYSSRIAPGQGYQVDILGGTSRCDGSGDSLPAGRYQVIAQVMDETGVPPRYLTPPVPITVVQR